MKTGIELIAEKRAKHVSKGWTAEHDAEHNRGELAMVAAGLAIVHTDASIYAPDDIPNWGLQNAGTIERLANSGALIAAEIDRLQSPQDNLFKED